METWFSDQSQVCGLCKAWICDLAIVLVEETLVVLIVTGHFVQGNFLVNKGNIRSAIICKPIVENSQVILRL